MAALQSASGLLGFGSAALGTRNLRHMIAADPTMNPLNYRWDVRAVAYTVYSPNGLFPLRYVVPKGIVTSQHYSGSAQGRALHETAQSYREAAKLGPYRNVATADVTVDGVRKTLRFKNDPSGMHSEQRLVAWHKLMTDRGRKVDVHGVYSERPPCGPMSANCRETLGNYFGQFLDVWHGNR